jgi:hypothetical protein
MMDETSDWSSFLILETLEVSFLGLGYFYFLEVFFEFYFYLLLDPYLDFYLDFYFYLLLDFIDFYFYGFSTSLFFLVFVSAFIGEINIMVNLIINFFIINNYFLNAFIN